MRLCIGRLLPPFRERTVKFTLPPIESVSDIGGAIGSPGRIVLSTGAGSFAADFLQTQR
jgi:hypothetical protein